MTGTDHKDNFSPYELDIPSVKIKKVQFLGDKAIIVIDKVFVKQLALDNQTYLREEVTTDGSIVLRIERGTRE